MDESITNDDEVQTRIRSLKELGEVEAFIARLETINPNSPLLKVLRREATSELTPWNPELVGLHAVRLAVARYISSEGCGCCEDRKLHPKHQYALGELLNVPLSPDKKGHEWFGVLPDNEQPRTTGPRGRKKRKQAPPDASR